MAICVPEYFYQTHLSSKMKLDDVSFIEFKSLEQEVRYETRLTCNLIAFILQGNKVVTDQDKGIHISQGTGMFLRKNHYLMSHIKGSRDKAYQSFLLFISDHYFKEFVDRHRGLFLKTGDQPGANTCIFKLTPLVKSTIDSVFPYFKYHHQHTKTILRMKLDEMLINLIQTDKTHAIQNIIRSIADKQKINLLCFLELNYANPWSLETFAKESGRSLTAFKTEFKQQVKTPPKKWINRKRLEKAKHLLQHSNYDVTEISHLAGYANLSHFIQSFKQMFQATPKQIQKAENQ